VAASSTDGLLLVDGGTIVMREKTKLRLGAEII
jgi:hypothetical protein